VADGRDRRERRDRLDQPKASRRTPTVRYDPEAFGRLTERVARFLGTGRYLIVQTVVIILWVAFNAIPGLPHFDPYAFLFLTLILSLQAAYSAPLILLAQNRQDDRDRINLEQDRSQFRQSAADLEYLARELAAVRLALGEVVTRDFLRSELGRLDGSRDRDLAD
jgi:uncharacterized membrane protein